MYVLSRSFLKRVMYFERGPGENSRVRDALPQRNTAIDKIDENRFQKSLEKQLRSGEAKRCRGVRMLERCGGCLLKTGKGRKIPVN